MLGTFKKNLMLGTVLSTLHLIPLCPLALHPYTNRIIIFSYIKKTFKLFSNKHKT